MTQGHSRSRWGWFLLLSAGLPLSQHWFVVLLTAGLRLCLFLPIVYPNNLQFPLGTHKCIDFLLTCLVPHWKQLKAGAEADCIALHY